MMQARLQEVVGKVSDLVPVRLRCGGLGEPLGVDDPAPVLSWSIEASGRGKLQSAYQVQVAGKREDFTDGESSLRWDSGRVETDAPLATYEGPHLVSGTRYFWRVRVWDENGEPSGWSDISYWETGLLERRDWGGCWIGLGEDPSAAHEPPTGEKFDEVAAGLAPSPYLRKTFTLEKPVRRARLYATARGLYEAHLNGERVGDHELAPGWTDYHRRIQYQTYDVTGLLRKGENAIGAILGDGWYCGYVGFDPKRRGAHYGERPQFLARLNVEYEDGTTGSLTTDGSWRSTTGPILHSDLLMGERYDARLEMDGWDEPGFDDSGWLPVKTEELGDEMLVAEPSQPIRVTQEVGAKSVTEPAPGVYVFDLGQNMVGRVRLKVRGEAGTGVRLRHAEVLNPDGTIYTENLRTARQTDTYILRGGGEEVYEPRFTFHGFRYVEVSGYPGEPPLEAVTGRVLHSDTPLVGSFECSDETVNRLQSNIVWGQRGNFLSVPTDCPQRDERLGWLGDAQVFIRTASFNADVQAFFTKWMRDVVDAQSAEGGFPDVAPRVVTLRDGAPAWGDAGIIVPWTIYRVYGDVRMISAHYGAMERWMDYIREANPDYLRKNRLNNNYGDWLAPFGDDTPRELLATAYWAYDAKLMAEMAEAIGREEDAAKYEKLFEKIKRAFNEAYVTPEGKIRGDTQTAYALALHMDLLPDEKREGAASHLVTAIEREDWHLSTGFAGVGYLLPVLTETGHADVAYRLLHQESFPSWLYTIKHGATTIWERWDGWTEGKGFQSPNMNSFNHYSLGSVGEWLYRYVAGIDAAEPGYGHVVIRPHPGGKLRWARASYESVRGPITSAWELSDGTFRLRASIPPNTTATVHLPAAPDRIEEGGIPLQEAEGIEVVKKGKGHTTLKVGSGEYEFTASSNQ